MKTGNLIQTSLLCALFILTGCMAAKSNIHVTHVIPMNIETISQYQALRETFVEINDQKIKSTFVFDADSFAQRLSQNLVKLNAKVLAYQKKPFLVSPQKFIQPTGILKITLKNADIKEFESSQSFGSEVTLTYTLEILSMPENESITKLNLSTAFSESRLAQSKPKGHLKDIQKKISQKIADHIIPKLIDVKIKKLTRPIFYDDTSPDSILAFEAALKEDWQVAKNIWRIQTQTTDTGWKEFFNLGVVTEAEGQSDVARDYYKKAREKAEARNEGGKINWNKIDQALSQSISSIKIDRGNEWFSEPLAVLPFQNRTQDPLAATLVRSILIEKIHASGFNPISTNEIDQKLKQMNLIQRGRVKPIKPLILAQRLGVKKILFGKIDQFEDQVAGRFTLWDKEANTWVWSTDKENKGGPDKNQAVREFVDVLFEDLPKKPRAQAIQ